MMILPRSSGIPRLRANLGGLSLLLMLLVGCATSFGIIQRDFQLLPPDTLEQSVTVLLHIERTQDANSHHWEAVLNVDLKQIDLVILSAMGQRLATLSFDGQQLTVDRNAFTSIDISLKKLLGELQVIFWPLAVLNTGTWNQNWHFEEQKHIRHVYYQQQLMAEIHRNSPSAWNGDFHYISKISDYRLNIRASQLDRS